MLVIHGTLEPDRRYPKLRKLDIQIWSKSLKTKLCRPGMFQDTEICVASRSLTANAPEKLPKPNRKGSSSSPTIFQGRAVKLQGCIPSKCIGEEEFLINMSCSAALQRNVYKESIWIKYITPIKTVKQQLLLGLFKQSQKIYSPEKNSPPKKAISEKSDLNHTKTPPKYSFSGEGMLLFSHPCL